MYIYLYSVHSSSFHLDYLISTIPIANLNISYIVRGGKLVTPTLVSSQVYLLPSELVGGKTNLECRFETFGRDNEFLSSALLLAASEPGMRRVASHTGEKGAREWLSFRELTRAEGERSGIG